MLFKNFSCLIKTFGITSFKEGKMILKFFIFFICFISHNVMATKSNSNNIPTQSVDILTNSIQTIEESVNNLTAQIEKQAHDQKQTKAETVIILKDLKLQVNDIIQKQNNINKILELHKIEIQNLKNTLSMLQELNSLKNKPENSLLTKNTPDDLLPLKKEIKEDVIEPIKTDDEKDFDKAFKLFNMKNYTDSAIQFAKNISEHKESKNFHKNLLYLGLSMKELDNINGACTAFSKIVNSSEIIEKSVLESTKLEFQKLNCKKNK